MLLFHGSYAAIEKPDLRSSDFFKDFGPGFYCTSIRKQAERWASRYDSSVVSVYEYTPSKLLCSLNFPEMSDSWLDFVAGCRSGKPHDYDTVEGAMANDQIWNYVADFTNGNINREQFWALAKFSHPTHQIVFCTEAALQEICFRESYEVRF